MKVKENGSHASSRERIWDGPGCKAGRDGKGRSVVSASTSICKEDHRCLGGRACYGQRKQDALSATIGHLSARQTRQLLILTPQWHGGLSSGQDVGVVSHSGPCLSALERKARQTFCLLFVCAFPSCLSILLRQAMRERCLASPMVCPYFRV